MFVQTHDCFRYTMLKVSKCFFLAPRRTPCGFAHFSLSVKEATKAISRCKRPVELLRVVARCQQSQSIDGVFCAAALHRLSILERHRHDVIEMADAWTLLSTVAAEHLDGFGAQEIAIAALAVAKARTKVAKVQSKVLFEKLLGQVLPEMQVSSEHLPIRYCANLVWAAATLRYQGAAAQGLFQRVAKACHQPGLHGLCNARDAAQILWAFATAAETHEGLEVLEKVAIEQRQGLENFSDHDLATTIWAIATLNCPGPQGSALLHELAGTVSEKDFAPQGLSMVLWGYATLNLMEKSLPTRRLLETLSPKVVAEASNFTPQGASNILWAFATIDTCLTGGKKDHQATDSAQNLE